MNLSRRSFIRNTGMLTAGSALLGSSCGTSASNDWEEKNTELNKILEEPVLKAHLFKDPVIIESVDLLHHDGNYICRVRSKDGAEGLSISNNMQMRYLYPIFLHRVKDFFIGKDARRLDELIDGVYVHRSNYKLQSLAIWVPVATLEFAVLDMLGKIAGKSLGELIGEIHQTRIDVYKANNNRGRSVEESIERIKKQVEETNARALKFKVGGRMLTPDDPPGRTEKLIPLVRETFGSEMTIYADANGAYQVEEAVKTGRLMQEYKYDFFEEPVPFDWYEETKMVKDQLQIPVAGGEQEGSMTNFRWLIANKALDIVQPDIFYFGGMIRSMKVAKMAHHFQMECTPHISGSGLGYLYMMHFVSALPNAGPYHEFKGFSNQIPFQAINTELSTGQGYVNVPVAPGTGIEIDPDFIALHKKMDD